MREATETRSRQPGLVVLTVLTLSAAWHGCFRSPELSKITCTDDTTCPKGYACVRPGSPGGCEPRLPGSDGSSGETSPSPDAVDLAIGRDSVSESTAGPTLDTSGEGASPGVDSGIGGAPDTPLVLDAPADQPPSTVDAGGTSLETGWLPGTGGDGGGTGGADAAAEDAAGGAIGTGGGAAGSTGTGGAGGVGGGASTGGSGTGGVADAGGSGTGGSGTGGVASTGGSGTGGITSTGGANTGGTPSRPAGYWMASDWGVTDVTWSGCVWTDVDSVTGSTSSIAPADFTGHAPLAPYRVSGSVFNSYESVALLGFNLNEPVTGSSDQCAYRVLGDTTVLPPGVMLPGAGGGVTVSWTAQVLPGTFRIELLGADGFSNPASRWCASITEVSGPSFIPFSRFNSRCWDNSGSTFDGSVPVSAIAFYVPGAASAKVTFDYTINSFTLGTTIGGAATADSNYQRVKVPGSDGRQYILQNNNFGSPTGSSQLLWYTRNSFKILSSTGASVGPAPISFPSLYVGANGNTAGGSFQTSDDNLPMRVSAIAKADASFAWSGGTGGKDFDAILDLWFAQTAAAAGSYSEPVSGDIQIWLYKPGGRQPIGSMVRQATIGGVSYDVWAGPSVGTNPGRPVISYVAKATTTSFSADLKAFVEDAVSAADTANGITQTFSSSWYLTDVFGGFEIWTGSDAVGLQCTGFTCVVQ